MKRKGFTLVELLVVIAIIALLMGILMPALAKVRQIAYRMVCGTNLSGIGKAMLIYANDYEDELPRAGGRGSVWGAPISAWMAADRRTAFGLGTDYSGGAATFTSCFYLLVKYAEVTPKSFICKGDSGASEFKISDEPQAVSAGLEFIDVWDFGSHNSDTDNPSSHCSYSYHAPFGLYALTTASEPGMAIAADRNPWIASPSAAAKDFGLFNPDGNTDEQKYGNAIAHQEDGQQVLFMDSHVYFEKRSWCGINDDNIYTAWSNDTAYGRKLGVVPQPGMVPYARTDSLLLNDGEAGAVAPPTPGR
jgi:prepilin-type N-terminal cleavage/methylation domain-containing protein